MLCRSCSHDEWMHLETVYISMLINLACGDSTYRFVQLHCQSLSQFWPSTLLAVIIIQGDADNWNSIYRIHSLHSPNHLVTPRFSMKSSPWVSWTCKDTSPAEKKKQIHKSSVLDASWWLFLLFYVLVLLKWYFDHKFATCLVSASHCTSTSFWELGMCKLTGTGDKLKTHKDKIWTVKTTQQKYLHQIRIRVKPLWWFWLILYVVFG